jgi:hypothetical protein
MEALLTQHLDASPEVRGSALAERIRFHLDEHIDGVVAELLAGL